MRTGLLIALLLPFCSAAPLHTNVDAEADRVQDGTHSHRDGNAYIHNKADIDVSFSGNTEFHDLSIGHHMEVNVHGDGGGHIQENPCSSGRPLIDHSGVELFCGRGPNRVECPTGSYCLEHPTDRYALCCPKVCTAGKVNEACFCDNGQGGGQDCAAEQVCTSGGACLDVCTAGKINQNCFCDNGQEGGQDCAAEQACTSGGACLDVCTAGKVNLACFCDNGLEGGEDCAAEQVCTSGGACLDVCTAGKVNEACFCDNGQEGGQDCAAEQVCTSGGACLDVTCPGEDGLSSVLLENNWRTQVQINAMTEEKKRTAIIDELVKMTGHTKEDLKDRDDDEVISIANIAALLIKYSIKLSSDVKTMYKPDLRNALITEISQHPSIQVSTLQSKTDDQLLKTFCKACPADAKITSDCMCGGNSCTEGNVCVAGSTCAPVCTAGALNSAACFCENAQLGQGGEVCTAKQGCHSDGTCLEVCSRERKKLVSDCICSTIFESVLCSAGNICNQDGMCMEVCSTDGKLEKGCYCGPEIEPCLRGNACLDGICQKKPLFFFMLLG